MKEKLLLGAVTLLAAALYLVGLGDAGLVGDEFTTARVSGEPVGEILRMTFVDVIDPAYGRNRPAHHLLVHLCQRVFDDVEFGSRLPAALAGIASVLALFALGRSLYGPREALLAALLLATAQGFVWASREARAYSPFVLFTILALLGAVRAVRGDGRRWWVLLGGACAVGYYFHPVATLPACAILAAAVLGQLPGLGPLFGAPPARRGLLIALGTGAILMLPALWCIGRLVWTTQLAAPGASELVATEPGPAEPPQETTVLEAPPGGFLDDRGREPVSFFERDFLLGRRCAEFLGPGTVWGFGVLGVLALGGLVLTFRGQRYGAWTLSLLFALPLAFLVTVATGHGFGARYLLFLVPVLALLDARALVWMAERAGGTGVRAGALAALGGLGLAALQVPHWGRDDTGPERDWPAAAAAIGDLADPGPGGHSLIVVGTTGRSYLMGDHMGREQTTFYLEHPERYDYRSVGALASTSWATLRGELDPATQVVGLVLHGASTDSLAALHRHPLAVRDVTGLSVIRPEDTDQPALVQLAEVMTALADLGPRDLDESLLTLRALDAMVAALEQGACPRLGPLVARLGALSGPMGPGSHAPALTYLDAQLFRAMELQAACATANTAPLADLHASLVPRFGLAWLAIANQAWKDRDPRRAADALTHALGHGVVREAQTRQVIAACRRAGMQDEASALERALASSLEALEERD